MQQVLALGLDIWWIKGLEFRGLGVRALGV